MASVNRRVLPGFSLTLGYTVFYLSLLVLLPIAACFLKAGSLSWQEFWSAVWTDRARAAYALTFGAALAAAVVNVILGLMLAWVLVRYRFPGKKIVDSLVDLPLALPTAVISTSSAVQPASGAGSSLPKASACFCPMSWEASPSASLAFASSPSA